MLNQWKVIVNPYKLVKQPTSRPQQASTNFCGKGDVDKRFLEGVKELAFI
jgi:hypothetical protein